MTENFRMRRKPTKPVRKTISGRISVYEGETLAGILEELDDETDLNEVKFTRERRWSYTNTDVEYFFEYELPEPDSSFDKRMKTYETKLSNWKEWYKQNKQEIDKKGKKVEAKNKGKREKSWERRIRELKSELTSMENKLNEREEVR
jgi:hypothetical protein